MKLSQKFDIANLCELGLKKVLESNLVGVFLSFFCSSLCHYFEKKPAAPEKKFTLSFVLRLFTLASLRTLVY